MPLNTPGDITMLESCIRHHSRTDARVQCGATQTMAFAELVTECRRRQALRAAGIIEEEPFVRYVLDYMRIELSPIIPQNTFALTCNLQIVPRVQREGLKRARSESE